MTRSDSGASRDLEQQSLVDIVEADPKAMLELAAARFAHQALGLLHRALTQAQMPQSQLAERLGITEGAVSQVLTGVGNIRLSTLAKYATAIGYRAQLNLVPIDAGREVLAAPQRRQKVSSAPEAAQLERQPMSADLQWVRATIGVASAQETDIVKSVMAASALPPRPNRLENLPNNQTKLPRNRVRDRHLELVA